jgi:hypothetical protein
MSDRRQAPRPLVGRAWRFARAIAGCSLFVPAATTAGAQDAGAIRRQADSLRIALEVARAEVLTSGAVLNARRDDVGRSRSALLTAGGRTVRFAPAELDAADTAALARGLEAAQRVMIERFGEEWATRLMGGEVWVATSAISGPAWRWVVLRTGDDRGAALSHLRRPLDAEGVVRFQLRVVGERLPATVGALSAFAGSSISLYAEEQRWAEAAREMALSWASAGRRCATGVIAACEAVMTRRTAGAPEPAWIAPGDERGAVTATSVPMTADSALRAMRRECFRGSVPDCNRFIELLPYPDPFSTHLRATLVMHAIEMGGRAAMDRLVSASDRDPLALSAHVAGMTPDSLLRSWQRRTAEALRAERGSTFPIALASFAWCALLLAATVRRRP